VKEYQYISKYDFEEVIKNFKASEIIILIATIDQFAI